MQSIEFAKFEGDRQIVWDATSLKRAGQCQMMYRLGTLEGWRGRGEPVRPLWGRAIHKGFEILDYNKFIGTPKDQALDEAITHTLTEFGPALKNSTENAFTIRTLVRALVFKADESYDKDHLRVPAMPDGSPALEVRFEVPFGDWRLSGRIDRMAEHDDRLYVVDTKSTSSQLDGRYFRWYHLDDQVYAYLWVARHVLGLPVIGLMIDGVQTLVENTRFGFHLVQVPDENLLVWKDSMLRRIFRIEMARTTNAWDQNFTSCRLCSYPIVCEERPSQQREVLNKYFDLRPYGTRTEPVLPPTQARRG